MTYREALLSMSYREVMPGKWAKPVGYHLFTFLEKKMLWENWFKAKKIELWNSEIMKDDIHFLEMLKQHEAYTRINVNNLNEPASQFQLSGIDL